MTTLETYFEQNILLAKSITIRLIDVGIAMNKGLVEEGYTIPTDKTKWKYFMNLAGIKHETNSDIEVTVIELGEKQSLSKELLDKYSYTKAELMANGDVYDELIENYPDDILYIHGCIYNEMDIEDIINASDGTIISWNSDLVETSEYRLIKELEVWVKDFITRYHVRQYTLVDELYIAAFVGVLYAQLPAKLVNLRFDKALTNEAHSFHMEHFFRSNLAIWDSINILNTETKYWLYKNLPWLINNIGRNETFNKIIDNILTPNAIGIGKYIIRRTNPTLLDTADTDTTTSAYTHGDIVIASEAINSYYDETKNNSVTIESMVMTEINSEGSENISDETQESTRISAVIAETQDTFDVSYKDKQATKILEISTYDIYKFSGFDLFKVILDYWIYCISIDSLQYQVEYVEPNNNNIYLLTPKAGLLVLIKMMITLTKQEDIKIKHINYDVPLELTSDIITAAYNELFDDELTSSHLQELIDNYPYITKVSSSVTEFNVLLQDIIKYYEYFWVLDANSENAFVSANLKYLANLITAKGSIILTDNEDGLSIDDLLAEEDIVYTIDSTYDIESSIQAIFEAFTGYDINVYSELTNIVTNIKSLLVKLLSYTSQVITTADSTQNLDNVRYNATQVMYSRKGIATVTDANFKQLEEDYAEVGGLGNNFVDNPTSYYDNLEVPVGYTLPEKVFTGKMIMMPNIDYNWIAPTFGASWCIETFGINHGDYISEVIDGITLSLAMKQLEEDYVGIKAKHFWDTVLACIHADNNKYRSLNISTLPKHPVKTYADYRSKEMIYTRRPNYIASVIDDSKLGINHGDYKELVYEWKIKITKLPDTLEYIEDFVMLDITGMEVTLYYTDDTTRLLSENEYTYEPSGLVTLDFNTITVTYKNFTDTFDITVTEAVPAKLEVYQPAKYLSYYPGLYVDVTDLILLMTYNNNKKELVYTDQITYTPKRALTLSDTKVTCYYRDLTCTYDITVGYLKEIIVQTPPTKRIYEVEEYFVQDGMEVIGIFSNGYISAITGFECSPKQLLIADNEYQETVTYTNETLIPDSSISTTFTICVYSVAEIFISNTATTLSYYQGETFDSSGLEITLVYTNGYTRILDESEYTIDIDETTLTTLGDHTVTILYTYDKLDNPVFTTSYTINVYAYYYTFNASLSLNNLYIHEDALIVDNNDSCIIVGELGEDYVTYPFVSSAEIPRFGFIKDNIYKLISEHVLTNTSDYIKTTLKEISTIDYVITNNYALHARNEYGFTKVIYLQGYTTVYIHISNVEKHSGDLSTDMTAIGPFYSDADSDFPTSTYFAKDAKCVVYVPKEYKDTERKTIEETTYDTFYYKFNLDGIKLCGDNISIQAFTNNTNWLQVGLTEKISTEDTLLAYLIQVMAKWFNIDSNIVTEAYYNDSSFELMTYSDVEYIDNIMELAYTIFTEDELEQYTNGIFSWYWGLVVKHSEDFDSEEVKNLYYALYTTNEFIWLYVVQYYLYYNDKQAALDEIASVVKNLTENAGYYYENNLDPFESITITLSTSTLPTLDSAPNIVKSKSGIATLSTVTLDTTESSTYTSTSPSELTFDLEAIRSAIFQQVISGDTGCVTLRWKDITNSLSVTEQGFVRNYSTDENGFTAGKELEENELLYIGINSIEVVEGIAETELDIEPEIISDEQYKSFEGGIYWEDNIEGKYGITSISDSYLIGITIDNQPNTTKYKIGETFDPTGMVVTAHKADGTSFVITDYSCSPNVLDFIGENTIYVNYYGFTDKLTVDAIDIERIEITTQPNKTEYLIDREFDPTGMVVTAIYTDNETKEVITDYTYDITTLSVEGEQVITIKYDLNRYNKIISLTTTTSVTVINEKYVACYMSLYISLFELGYNDNDGYYAVFAYKPFSYLLSMSKNRTLTSDEIKALTLATDSYTYEEDGNTYTLKFIQDDGTTYPFISIEYDGQYSCVSFANSTNNTSVIYYSYSMFIAADRTYDYNDTQDETSYPEVELTLSDEIIVKCYVPVSTIPETIT